MRLYASWPTTPADGEKRTRVTQHNSHHSRIKQPRCIAMNGTHHASCISPPLIDPIPPYITLLPLAMHGFSFLAGGTTSEAFLVASLSPLFLLYPFCSRWID